jgi:lipopolysaccharide/colanic/teichoic acid biosynthesis glycosyltransferase
MLRHKVRPACGSANHGRGNTSLDRRIEHDLDYIENWSLLRDLKILLVTLFGGFHDRGTRHS